MLENQEGTTPEPTIDELKAKVAYLESSVNIASLSRDSHMNKLTAVREYIQASIDNDNWTDSELEEIFWEELAELLDLEISKTVEILISATWSATVKMKRSEDLDDLDISVESPELSWSSSAEMTDVYERDLEVNER